MTSTKLYTAIYVVLFVLATLQVLIEQFEGFTYWTAFAIIMVVSTAKAIVVAGYYQHLRSEPRSVSYVMLGGLLAALALTVAASYSIM
ncbi:cytochrome C oxidase subunit IV family protein [Halorarum halophilum]|uniref:Cytochrome C oxidase subunit IV family protein n=1 Tax=Halorarum halophilum TaxID=2743090 RepID=A0A7D5GCG7_9EURY|nr:cytochrome C oxidase subunit IV family protein [Halobaculum halophilum]QLG28226.1 cytochrome C oxidase subunit IV family protein [Halobaculum halophilum]